MVSQDILPETSYPGFFNLHPVVLAGMSSSSAIKLLALVMGVPAIVSFSPLSDKQQLSV
jgi:hypothetical protein